MRGRIAVILCAAIAGAAIALALFGSWNTYESTAVVSGTTGTPQSARSPDVARRALDLAGARSESSTALLSHSTVTRRANGDLVFTVRADDSDAAQRLADAYSRAYTQSGSQGAAVAHPAGPATRETDIVVPLVAGAAIGAAAGLLLLVLRGAVTSRRGFPRRRHRRGGNLEVIGHVPDPSAYPTPAEATWNGELAESYGRLAAGVIGDADAGSSPVLLVAGVVPEDDGTHVAVNLAAALAAVGRRVAVVELDPDDALVASMFGISPTPGLSDVLRGDAQLDTAVVSAPGFEHLTVLPAGSTPSARKPSGELFDSLTARNDIVIVCGPALVDVARKDLPHIDGAVPVVSLRDIGEVPWSRREKAVGQLDAPVLGYVLVSAPLAQIPEPRHQG
jgi:Mrp family chromosome partitioning ATPase